MPYREISDLRVSLYAPVSARLIRNLRDNARAVGVHVFHGPFSAQVGLTKNFGDPNTTADPPTVFSDVATFDIDVPPPVAVAGVDTRLSCYIELLVSGSPTGVSKAYFRLSDGTVHTTPIPYVAGITTPAFFRVEWLGAATPGLKTWRWQMGAYVPSSGGTVTGSVRHRATEHGSFITSGG